MPDSGVDPRGEWRDNSSVQIEWGILLTAVSAFASVSPTIDDAGIQADARVEFDAAIGLVAADPYTRDPDLDAESQSGPIIFDTAIRPTPFLPRSVDALFADPIWDDEPGITSRATAEQEPGAFHIRFDRGVNIIETGFRPQVDLTEEVARPRSTGERYTLSMEWIPAGADSEIQWLVLGGVHAGRVELEGFDADASGGTFAIPTIGTGFRWVPTESLSFSTIASTQTHEQDGNLVDIAASAEIRLSPGVDLTAGYEYYRADISVDDLRSSLNREGVFAKITIRF